MGPGPPCALDPSPLNGREHNSKVRYANSCSVTCLQQRVEVVAGWSIILAHT